MQSTKVVESELTESLQNEPLYEFSTYPFEGDAVFQEGLQSIISAAQGKSSGELEDIIGRAKTFYFARITGRKVTWENYLEWRKSHPLGPFPDPPSDLPGTVPKSMVVDGSDIGNTEVLSFQRITELIQTGQTHLIPNNKVIPDGLHNEPPTQSAQVARKKPWEREILTVHQGPDL
ncbi:hypothetical protein BU17DRAFT_95079 [Hysterangium stoloniferum]|nr:hypothetical protein BU17DRAFT_95079 [Hysterangium stoloniferum]